KLEERLLVFGRRLREEGMSVGTGRILDFQCASALLGPADLYWVGRATLVGRHEDIPTYDRVFQSFWSGAPGNSARISYALERVRVEADDESGDETGEQRDPPGAARASRLELLRTKSFADMTSEELSELARLVARLRVTVPMRRVRRRRPARRGT